MKVLTYDDLELEVLCNTNDIPGAIARLCEVSTNKHVNRIGIIQRLVEMNHMSPFEFIHFDIGIQNVSRSFLAQITRHRIGSFMSGSQHYQDYSDYPCVIHPTYKSAIEEEYYESTLKDGASKYINAIQVAFIDYANLVVEGVPHEEARQVLPNAAAVVLRWSVNLRSLLNFLNLRCCNRNTAEMHHFANTLRMAVLDYCPDLKGYVGADCTIRGKRCTQGRMQCAEGKWQHDYCDKETT